MGTHVARLSLCPSVKSLARDFDKSEYSNMKEQAEFYRVGLLLGLFKISDVIAWCDSVIMAEAAPDLAIIEASMSGGKGVDAVVSALSEMKGEFDSRSVKKRIFRSMHDLVNQDREQALRIARLLYGMAFDDFAWNEEIEQEMRSFDNAFDDVAYRNYTEEKITDEMLQFLKKQSTSLD